MKELLVIANPTAREGAGAEEVKALLQRRSGIEVRWTGSPKEARQAAAEAAAAGFRRIAAAGGDGSVSAVVNGLAGAFDRVALGVIPAGTANDWAKTAGIPLELDQALEVCLEGEARPMDLMRVRLSDDAAAGEITPERYVINAVTGGLSHQIAENIDPQLKRRWRGLAYFRAAVSSISDSPSYEITAQIDDERVSLRAHAVVVANGQYAGGMKIVPEAEADDRRLDVAVVSAERLSERLRLLGQAALGRHLESENILYRRAKQIRLTSAPKLPLRCDGEDAGHTPAQLEAIPRVLRVLTPG